jgi:hypothetical protein
MKFLKTHDEFVNEMFDDPLILKKFKYKDNSLLPSAKELLDVNDEDPLKALTALVRADVPSKIPNIKKEIEKVISDKTQFSAKKDFIFISLANALMAGFRNLIKVDSDSVYDIPFDANGFISLFGSRYIKYKVLERRLAKKKLNIKTIFPNYDLAPDEPQFMEFFVEPQIIIYDPSKGFHMIIKLKLSMIKSLIREDLYILDFDIDAKDYIGNIDLSDFLNFSHKTKYDKYIDSNLAQVFGHIATYLNSLKIDLKNKFPLIGEKNVILKKIKELKKVIGKFNDSLSVIGFDVFF